MLARGKASRKAHLKRFIDALPLASVVEGVLADLSARGGRAKKSLRDIFPLALNFVFFSVLGDMVVSLIKWLIHLPF